MNVLSEIEKEYLESLGFIYIQHGKFEVAEVILSALSRCFTDDFHILRSLSYVKLMQGEREIALSCAREALHIHPDDNVSLLIEAMSGGGELKPESLLELRKNVLN